MDPISSFFSMLLMGAALEALSQTPVGAAIVGKLRGNGADAH